MLVACGVVTAPEATAAEDATRAATEGATWNATWAATEDATRDATLAATTAATRAATMGATMDATRDAAEDATRAATLAATMDATRAATWPGYVALLVRCCEQWRRLWHGGSTWSYAASYYDAFRRMGLDIDWSRWTPYADLCRSAGPTMMHRRFAIICDRPDILRQDAEHRPHSEVGPAIRWRTGRSLYYWHGTQVPAAWIEDRASLSAQVALTHPQIEQRRAAAEILGWDRILAELSPTVIDRDPDPTIGALLSVDLPDAPGSRFLRVQCGTGRTFVLPVPDEMTTARRAQAWTWGEDEYTHGPRT